MTPVAIFCHRRPGHLRRTIEALASCDGFADHPVTVFSDGPRTPEEAEGVAAVREVVRDMLGSRADLRAAETNRGLARSIIGGVSELCDSHGRVIVIEDDLDLAPSFLTHMTRALDRHADDPRVMQVSGHMFDVPEFAGRDRTVFLPLITTWGWATWGRAWKAFDAQAAGWEALLHDRALRHRFNVEGAYDYTTMLRRQMEGRRDSWGVRWYWSVFREQGLTVFPPRTLVRNMGQDGSGTHGSGWLRGWRRTNPEAGWPASAPETCAPARLVPEDFAAVKRAILAQNGGARGKAVDAVRRLIRR